MKNTLILIFTLCTCVIYAQKHDNIWMCGYSDTNGSSPNSKVSLCTIDFSKQPIEIKMAQKSKMDVSETFANISDKTGKLAFYSNGQLTENFKNDSIKNCLFFENHDLGWTIVQGTMILPYPQKDSLYLVMYQGSGFIPGTTDYGIKQFYYATIDMSKNKGEGEIIEKTKTIFNYIPAYGKLSAVKHGNGIDWWILVMEFKTNVFHRYILNKNGLQYVGKQSIGVIDPQGVGASVFSPDGTKYARYDDIAVSLGQSMDLYDFDRCSGLLSNNRRVTYMDKGGAGVVFSPNSQFLYVGLGDEIRQYDTKAADLKKSEKSVAKRDKHVSCGTVPEGFYNGQLAPDGKIYFCTDGCSTVLHVIHQPDLAGTACKVELHGVTLPVYSFKSLPNFPNYKLGKMQGCSTATVDINEPINVEISPNPATSNLQIKLKFSDFQKGIFHLYDTQGNLAATYPLLQNQDEYRFDISNLSNGMYFWHLILDDKVRQTGKIVVMKE
jgi:hypothetical protein